MTTFTNVQIAPHQLPTFPFLPETQTITDVEISCPIDQLNPPQRANIRFTQKTTFLNRLVTMVRGASSMDLAHTPLLTVASIECFKIIPSHLRRWQTINFGTVTKITRTTSPPHMNWSTTSPLTPMRTKTANPYVPLFLTHTSLTLLQTQLT